METQALTAQSAMKSPDFRRTQLLSGNPAVGKNVVENFT